MNVFGDDRQLVILTRGPRRGDVIEVQVEAVDHEGWGEARLQAQVGPDRRSRRYRVRVRQAVPGDRARVLVERCRRAVIEARIDRLVEPSSLRVSPRCCHFGPREQPGKGCGGCSLQSVAYAAQLELKRALVARGLVEGGLDAAGLEVPAVRGATEQWHYRNKMELSFGDTRERRFALGLHPLGYRREVLNLVACHLAAPFVARLAAGVRQWAEHLGLRPYLHRRDEGFLRTLAVRDGCRTGQRLVELTTAGDDRTVLTARGPMSAQAVAERFAEQALALSAQAHEPLTSVYWTEQRVHRGQPTRFVEHLLVGQPALQEQLRLSGDAALQVEIHPRSFFQPNTLQAEELYAEVLRLALADGRPEHALDLYCGTGTIGLCLAAAGVPRVTGIELVEAAVQDARRNAARNGLEERTRFIVGDVGQVLRQRRAELGQVDLLVVDPPRAGLLPAAIGQLQLVDAPRLVYVSCNPRALGRDLALLHQAGYRTLSLQPIDLFPQTAHVETVVLLARGARGRQG